MKPCCIIVVLKPNVKNINYIQKNTIGLSITEYFDRGNLPLLGYNCDEKPNLDSLTCTRLGFRNLKHKSNEHSPYMDILHNWPTRWLFLIFFLASITSFKTIEFSPESEARKAEFYEHKRAMMKPAIVNDEYSCNLKLNFNTVILVTDIVTYNQAFILSTAGSTRRRFETSWGEVC